MTDDPLGLLGSKNLEEDDPLGLVSNKGSRVSLPDAPVTNPNFKSNLQKLQEAYPEDSDKKLKEMSEDLIRAGVYGVPLEQASEGRGIFRAVESGFNMSVTGLAMRNKYDEYEPDGTVEELAQMASTFVGDLPAIIGGYFAGGGQITGVAGAFALPMGIRKVYIDRLTKGEMDGPQDFVERMQGALLETSKGLVTGAATGAVGRFAPYGFKTVGEIATMTTVGSLLEGQVPSLKDFVNAAMFVGTLKGVAKAQMLTKDYMTNRYRKTGEHPYITAGKLNERIPPETWELPETAQIAALRKAFADIDSKPNIENLNRGIMKDLGLDKITKEEFYAGAKEPNPRGEIIKQAVRSRDGEKLVKPAIREKDLFDLKFDKDLDKVDVEGAVASYTTPPRLFEKMPAIKALIYDVFDRADVKRVRATKAAEDRVKEIFKGLAKSNDKAILEHAYYQQAEGRKLLNYTYGVKDYKPRALDAREMAVYNELRTNLKTLFTDINAARVKAGIKPFQEVENYFTFFQKVSMMEKLGLDIVKIEDASMNKYIRVLNEELGIDIKPTRPSAGLSKADQQVKDLVDAKFLKPSTNAFRFAKDRTKAVYEIGDSAKTAYLKYVNSAYKHIYIGPEIAKAREYMLKLPDGDGTFLMKESKPNTYKFLNRWLNEQAGLKDSYIEKTFGTKWDRRLAALNNNITVATLSMSIRSFLIQPTAILNTTVQIGPKYTMRGVASLLSGEGETAMRKSNLIAREYDVAVAESLAGLTGVKNTLAERGMFLLKYLDMQTAKASWLGAYEKAKDFYRLPESEAITYANNTVVKTQASARTIDKAPIQYDNLGKALTLFQTFVINDFNFIKSDILGIRNKNISKQEAVKKAMGYIAGITMINILFEDIIGINSPYPAPINAFENAMERGDEPLQASWIAMLELGTMLPTVGGGLRYGGSGLGGTPDFIKDAIQFSAGKPFAKPWWEIGGKALGVPGIVQAKKVIKGETLKEMTLGRQPQ